MPPVRRSGFVNFGNSDIIKVHSQRVNGKMCSSEDKTDKFNLVTMNADHEGMCNVWSIHKPTGKFRKMLCQRCRYFYNKDKKRWPFSGVPSMYYDIETNEVDVNFHQLKHFNECTPEEMGKVRGLVTKNRTTNHAESYHGRQRLYFLKKKNYKLDGKLLGKEDELSAEEIALIVKKKLRQIGGYLKWIDTLEDEEEQEIQEEELTAFEATDDEE